MLLLFLNNVRMFRQIEAIWRRSGGVVGADLGHFLLPTTVVLRWCSYAFGVVRRKKRRVFNGLRYTHYHHADDDRHPRNPTLSRSNRLAKSRNRARARSSGGAFSRLLSS